MPSKLHRSLIHLCLAASFASAATPTTNPLAEYYTGNEGYPAWSDEIRWANVTVMANKGSGAANFAEFEAKRDQLFTQGGGVLYYPAGTYDFEVIDGPNGRGLLLKDGVVIRGETPATDRNAVKTYDTHGLLSLGTVFNFTTKNGSLNSIMNFIGCTPATASKAGIVWVKTVRAYLFFGFGATKWADTWGVGQSWQSGREIAAWKARKPDGTFIMDVWVGDGTTGTWESGDVSHGSKRFVFGCLLGESYINNYVVNSGTCATFVCDAESWRYGGVLTVYGAHVFVENNVVSKIAGDKSNRLVVDVNKQLLPLFRNRCDVRNGAGYYAEDVIVRDNWVYNKGNKSFEISGKYMVARNNKANKEFLSDTPVFASCLGQNRNDDYMNRGFDIGGANVWLDRNEVRETGSGGNDGEGILVQRHNEMECFSHAWTYNEAYKYAGQPPDKGYIAPYDVHVTGLLTFGNKTSGNVGIRKVVTRDNSGNILYRNFTQDISIVKNTAADGLAVADVLDYIAECPSGSPAKPRNVSVQKSAGGYSIAWEDAADNEIGFRVERRIGTGTPGIIAYRPRHSAGSATLAYNPTGGGGGGPCNCTVAAGYDFNEQKWVDYTVAAQGGDIYFRVVAINCDDGDLGASDWVKAGTSSTTIGTRQVPARRDSHAIIGDNSVFLPDGAGLLVTTSAIRLHNAAGQTIHKGLDARAVGSGLSLAIGRKSLGRGLYFLSFPNDNSSKSVIPLLID